MYKVIRLAFIITQLRLLFFEGYLLLKKSDCYGILLFIFLLATTYWLTYIYYNKQA